MCHVVNLFDAHLRQPGNLFLSNRDASFCVLESSAILVDLLALILKKQSVLGCEYDGAGLGIICLVQVIQALVRRQYCGSLGENLEIPWKQVMKASQYVNYVERDILLPVASLAQECNIMFRIQSYQFIQRIAFTLGYKDWSRRYAKAFESVKSTAMTLQGTLFAKSDEEMKQDIKYFAEQCAKETQKLRFCANCKTYAGEIKSCSVCGSVRYCSRECQVAHWPPQHKTECKKRADEKKQHAGTDASVKKKKDT